MLRGSGRPLFARERRRAALAGARARLLETHACQFVGALVEHVAGMAAHPMPADSMTFQQGIEPLPEIDIPDRLPIGGAPAVALPLVDPRQDTIAQILAGGVNVDETGP